MQSAHLNQQPQQTATPSRFTARVVADVWGDNSTQQPSTQPINRGETVSSAEQDIQEQLRRVMPQKRQLADPPDDPRIVNANKSKRAKPKSAPLGVRDLCPASERDWLLLGIGMAGGAVLVCLLSWGLAAAEMASRNRKAEPAFDMPTQEIPVETKKPPFVMEARN